MASRSERVVPGYEDLQQMPNDRDRDEPFEGELQVTAGAGKTTSWALKND